MEFEGRLIQLRPKRDHKTQKRIQAAIPTRNITLLKRTFPEAEIINTERLIGTIVGENELTETGMSETVEATTTKALAATSAKALDKYYTKKEVAEKLCVYLEQNRYLKDKFVLEPSAGGGVFIQAISKVKPELEIVAYDIAPEISDEYCVNKANFLEESIISDVGKLMGKQRGICIGNPPFGRNNSLAIKFFNQAARISNIDTIAMIFPRSFGKETVKAKLDLSFSLVYEQNIDDNSFTLEGVETKVPSCFQIWIRQERDKIKAAEKPRGWEYTKQSDAYDIEIVRVGGKTGTAFPAKEGPKANYNYYIKLEDSEQIRIKSFVEAINVYDFSEIVNKTTGPKSLSKRELNPILNSLNMDIK
jgi:predicted RNA methylase